MDRRSALSVFFAPGAKAGNRASLAINSGLDPYDGPWGYEQAAHLLRRTMYGPAKTHIQWAIAQGKESTLDKLFEELPLPAPPVNSYYPNDPHVPIGSTWVTASYNGFSLNDGLSYRGRSLSSWLIGQFW